jgi:hypothetical protein
MADRASGSMKTAWLHGSCRFPEVRAAIHQSPCTSTAYGVDWPTNWPTPLSVSDFRSAESARANT